MQAKSFHILARNFAHGVVGFSLITLLAIGACSRSSVPNLFSTAPPWRAASERKCLSSGRVVATSFLQPMHRLGGPGVCGAIKPFRVQGLGTSPVRLKPAATLRCPMVPAVDAWLNTVVQPAAHNYLGRSVVEIQVAASYSCRTRNNRPGARLSEHAFANALDISAFTLSDGRRVTVLKGWKSRGGEARFLRAVHRGACRIFTTVIGPDGDSYHRNHFHLDLARHSTRRVYRVCR